MILHRLEINKCFAVLPILLMTTFRIGQWVVFDVDEPLEDGIGTVVGEPFLAPGGPGDERLAPKQKILWHLTGEKLYFHKVVATVQRPSG